MRVSEAFVDHVARSERKLILTLTSGMGSLADNTSGGSIALRERDGVETFDRNSRDGAVR